ncbi:MAG: alkaline phosphatase family protein [Planctomycetota bacterium]|jgi:predicted AlkP superfamily phosphohydrolase/phosphomutase
MPAAKKVMIIGYDAPMTPSMLKYAEAGHLPNLAKLMRQGTWADNCLVPHPTITPPNWTTIVTGAWPGTHGIPCFNLKEPGGPLDHVRQAFCAADNKAEYFWNSAARDGKTTLLMNYPTTYPRAIKKGIQLGGAGLGINEWRLPDYSPFEARCGLSADTLFSTEDDALATPIEMTPADRWVNLPKYKAALEAELTVAPNHAYKDFKPQRWYLCVLKTGTRFDKAIIATKRDGEAALATLKPGKMNERIAHTFTVGGKKARALFCMKLLDLSATGRKVRLYLGPICPTEGWATPAGACKELADCDGLPIPCSFYSYYWTWFDLDTLLELIDIQNRWFADAATRLMATHKWDIFCMHAHAPDHCYHDFANAVDPGECKDKKVLAKHQAADLAVYQSLDRMLGKILTQADENTLVVMVSDHGALPTRFGMDRDNYPWVNVNDILAKAGLLKYKAGGGKDQKEVDWKRTKAYSSLSVHVFVNLKGRDPDGIVKPGAEYEQVCQKIIAALQDYVEPRSKERPFVFAMKRADALVLGLKGEMVGDVIFGGHGWAMGEHGWHVPTAEYGVGSMRGLLMMAGPGIKRGSRLERTCWLTDIVPTICYLTGFPLPRDAEGAVIYQALSDPDDPHGVKTARKHLRGLENAARSKKMLTHRY